MPMMAATGGAVGLRGGSVLGQGPFQFCPEEKTGSPQERTGHRCALLMQYIITGHIKVWEAEKQN